MTRVKGIAAVTALGFTVAVAGALAGAAGQPAAAEAECECVFLTQAEMEWEPGPASLPRGAEYTILSGHPGEEGLFAMRIRFPAGYEIPPHFHPADEHVTVISGTFNMGKGEEVDRSDPYMLMAGSFAMIPADDRHFAWTEEPTVIQLHGMGPWRLTYIDPADDPRRQ